MITINVDVVSDVMCPWCYIGKRRLEAALSDLPDDVQVDVHWRPYQLDSTLPKDGKDRQLYLSEKFGGAERAREFYGTIADAGRAEKIHFDFDGISVSPNTLDAHRLIRWSATEAPGVQNRLVELLFRAYFTEGRNIGDNAVLLDAAEEAGMDRAVAETLLFGDTDRAEVEAEIETAHKMGVTGVPCFILNNKYVVMGAQSGEVLASAIREVADQIDSNS